LCNIIFQLLTDEHNIAELEFETNNNGFKNMSVESVKTNILSEGNLFVCLNRFFLNLFYDILWNILKICQLNIVLLYI